MKHILCGLIILTLMFSQIGCNKKASTLPVTKEQATIDEQIKDTSSNSNKEIEPIIKNEGYSNQEIKLIKKQSKTKYLLSNGIEIKHVDKTIETSKWKVKVSLVQVVGIKDKVLEANLNRNIEKDIEVAAKDFVDKTDKNQPEFYLYCEETLNANNLLCIRLNNLYSPPLYGVLYRLTDGKRLSIKESFTEGTDYIALINQKIRENVLAGGVVVGAFGDEMEDDEAVLSQPFTSIKQDQNFLLSPSKLSIIFNKGEEGFVVQNAVEIPLVSIDDYVDVMDRYSGTERKDQEKASLIVRNNNIFTTNKSSVIKRSNGELWMKYFQVSGLKDAAFEEIINTTIENAVKEVEGSSTLNSLVKNEKNSMDSMKNCIALVEMNAMFNHYGILCIERRVENSQYKQLNNFHNVYSFDLINKKPFSAKAFLNDYFIKNKDSEQLFTSEFKKALKSKYKTIDAQFIDKIDYSYIMERCIVAFNSGYSDPNISINIYFNDNTVNGVSDDVWCQIPLKTILKGQPEDFFGW